MLHTASYLTFLKVKKPSVPRSSEKELEALAKFIDSIGCQHGAWEEKMAPNKRRCL